MCPPPVATTSDSRLRNSCSAIDNVTLDQSALSRFPRLLSGAQRLECDDDGKQAVGVLPRSNDLLCLSLGYSAANFLVPQIMAHEDAKTQLFVVNDELAHHIVEK